MLVFLRLNHFAASDIGSHPRAKKMPDSQKIATKHNHRPRPANTSCQISFPSADIQSNPSSVLSSGLNIIQSTVRIVDNIGHQPREPNIPANNWYEVRASCPSSVLSPSSLPSIICGPIPIIIAGNKISIGMSFAKLFIAPVGEIPRSPVDVELMSLPSKTASFSVSPTLVANS